jgi:ubiquinone biosynthesis protein
MNITTLPQFYRNLNNLNRWREIIAVLSKYGLADWLKHFDFGLAKGFFRDTSGEALANLSRETRIRMALTELGPTFIKLGQVLSTRADLVGTRLADELQQLQTDVASDPPAVVRATLAAELGKPLDELFANFEDTPIASASIGQVHRAWLKTGQKVAVKVQHAGIEDVIRVDLDILAGLAPLAERIPEFANYRPRATVAEFQRTLRRELDFLREQRNLRRFAQDLADQPDVHIPAPFPELSTSRVLTMEFLDGIKVADAAGGSQNGHDLDQIARTGASMYLEMIFTNGLYHADPHPGNLILLEGNKVGLVDFGMVGRIDENLRESIEEMLLGILDQDAEQVATIITRLGSVPPDLDYNTLSIDVAEFVSQYGNQNLREFSLSAALTDVTEIIRRYHIMLPARAAMLLKVLIMLEGTARLLSPDFSLMELISPYRRKMLWRRVSPARRMKKLSRIYSEFERLAEILPRRLTDMIAQMHSGKFDVHLDHRGLEPSVNRLVLGMLASALFLGSSLLVSHKVAPTYYDVSILGAAGMSLSIFLGWRLLRAINKSGHLRRHD